MFNDTRTLLKEHGGLISAGFLLFFFSIFGQSAIFGAYLPAIQAELGLSKTAIGGLYATATIASGFLLIYTGKLLDRHRLRHFLAVALVGLAAGCFLLAAAFTPIMLLISFFLLRQCGQGLMVHSANTAINRYLETGRGKAMGMITQGGPMHVLIFPPFALWMAQYVDWRVAWLGYGLFTLLVLLPAFWFYLRRHQSTTHALWERRQAAAAAAAQESARREWSRRHVLRDWRFYVLCSLFIIAPFIGTVIFLYQQDIAASLGVTPLAFAMVFPVIAVALAVFNIVSGYMIDKWGEVPVMVTFPIMYTAGLLLIGFGNGMTSAYIAMALMGGAGAMAGTVGGPMIAHMYGTKHLGAIKALLHSVAILSSALSPFIFGFLMDQGHDINTILAWSAVYTGLIWVIVPPVFTVKNRKTA